MIKASTNRKPVCDFQLVINSNWHPISYRFGVIAAYCSNSDTLRFWATLWGLRDNVRCSSWAHWKARSGLPISVNWTSFAGCYGWRATSENRSEVGDFAPTRSFDSKFQVEGVAPPPPIIFARIVRPMNALQLYPRQFSHRCYGWGATSENRSKIGDFAPMRWLWSKISGTRGRPPPIIFARLVEPMNALQLCRWQFSHKETL